MLAPDPCKAFQEALSTERKILRKELSRLKKQYARRKETLEQSLAWNQVHHEGLLLQANLFRIQPKMTAIEVVDWELPEEASMRTLSLDTTIPPAKQVAKLFLRSKKLRAAIPHAQRLLEETEKATARCELRIQGLEECHDEASLQAFCKMHGILQKKTATVPKVAVKAPKLPYKTFMSATGCPIWAGKSAKDNDLLTFHHAKGSDWWLHAHNYAGSHVVIPLAKGKEPDEATLRDAAETALRMSQGKKTNSGEVAVTQVKWVRRVKGSPGKVMLSDHRVLRHDLDDDRWNSLRARMKAEG